MNIDRSSFMNSPGSNAPLDGENFVICPQLFLTNLTPEQYRAQQELYRRAYEKALRETQQDSFGDRFSFEI